MFEHQILIQIFYLQKKYSLLRKIPSLRKTNCTAHILFKKSFTNRRCETNGNVFYSSKKSI